MLMTTKSARCRASSTRRRCPSWRKPIVGTKATRAPAERAAPTARRASATLVAVCIAAPRALEAVVGIGVGSAAYLVGEAAHGVAHVVGHRRVLLEELRSESVVEGEQVRKDE